MKIQGTITKALPVQGGTSRNGNPWKKQSFVVEYVHGEYPKAILLDTMDENVVGKLQEGQEVSVEFDFTVREWTSPQGVTKYFNEPRIWRDGLHAVNGQQAPTAQPAPAPAPKPAVSRPTNNETNDPLPF